MAKPLQPRQEPQRMMQVRGANRALVLQLLRKHRHISRAEIARRTGLSEGAISRITAELLREKLILEQGHGTATGGRPGLRLELDRAHVRSVGVEIHEWQTRISLGSLDGQILESHWLRTPSSPTRTLDAIASSVVKLRRTHGDDRFHGVGVSARGIVDDVNGVIDLGSSPEWNGVPVKQMLEERIGLPVYVENNVRAAALAEYTYGGADMHNSRCMVLVRVDEGVGMGILLEGKLYRGPHRASGEFGQMVIADSPGAGAHDRAGCLELLAANPAIASLYATLSGTSKVPRGEAEATVRTICHLAMAGDAHAARAITDTMRYLGIGIANVVWGLDADVVLIHGAVTEAWPLALSAIQEQFPSGREFPHFRDLILRPCALGQEAGIVGALTLPFVGLFATGHSRHKSMSAAVAK